MKHKHILILFLLSFFFLVGITVKADMGPKPSTYVTFNGLDRDLYVTLISKEEGHGPWSPDAHQEFDTVDSKFKEYAENNNYYYLGYKQKITKDNNTFTWTYYAPDDFVIICYNESDDILLSHNEVLSRYAFDSYFELDYNSQSLSNVRKSYNYGSEILHLLLRVVLTILIELLLAYFVFRFKKKSFLIIIITNLITQIFLNIFLNISNYINGSLVLWINYIFIELLIVFVEAITYAILIPRIDKDNNYKVPIIILYAIIANALSFGLGFLIIKYIPGLG